MSRYTLLPIFLVASTPTFFAQNRAPRIVSPEIRADRHVTFRLSAPTAQKVTLGGTFIGTGQPRPELAKNESGVWSVTVGPIDSGVHSYSFNVDGLTILDPSNPSVKRAYAAAGNSQLFIPAETPAAWQIRNVPHGSLHQHWYTSPANGETLRFHVYTPPAYDPASKKSYPILYLLHGSGDTDDGWTGVGQANFILDNLIADGKAKPMIVVMPLGHIRTPAPQGASAAFEKDLIEGVMPMAEKAYRVDASQKARAIAGLSMGGGQALNVGLAHLDKFSHIGVFSMGVRDDRFQQQHAKVLGNAKETNSRLKKFYVICGDKDSLYPGAQKLDDILTKHGIEHVFQTTPGGHTWNNWVNYLGDFAPKLF